MTPQPPHDATPEEIRALEARYEQTLGFRLPLGRVMEREGSIRIVENKK